MTRLCPFRPKGLGGRACRSDLVWLGPDSDGLELFACRECRRVFAFRERPSGSVVVLFDREAPDA